MTVFSPAAAAAAYASTARAALAPGLAHPGDLTAGEPIAGPSFATYLGDAAQHALAVGKGAENQAVQAVAGHGDLTEVVSAVANAELTLQTVVAVRDRVVSAYQDIMRMPM